MRVESRNDNGDPCCYQPCGDGYTYADPNADDRLRRRHVVKTFTGHENYFNLRNVTALYHAHGQEGPSTLAVTTSVWKDPDEDSDTRDTLEFTVSSNQ